MSHFARISVSLERSLVEQFDRICLAGNAASRSEAIRELIREKLMGACEERRTEIVAASLTLVNVLEQKRLTDRLPKTLLGLGQIVATMHVPLTPQLGMELISLRGRPADLN